MDTVGIVGLGLMGSALAERFLDGKLRVFGYDLREECRQQFVALGGEAASSSRDVFAATPTIMLSLPTSDTVRAVIEDAWDLLPGKGIIDSTTGDPDVTAELGRRLAEHGVEYLDATLTGSSQVAHAGELIVTAGGNREFFQKCEGLFKLFAQRWFHVGSWGSGARTKLVVNLVLGLNRAVLAEGLGFARACGLDLGAMLEILKSGGAYSRVMDVKGRKMIDGDFAPEAKLAQHLKDVRLILEAGRKTRARLSLSFLHEKLLENLVERGLGDADNSAIIQYFGLVED